jgi:hypothetical protein
MGSEGTKISENMNLNSAFGLADSQLYKSDWFEEEKKPLGIKNLDLYMEYLNTISQKYNFNSRFYNSYIYSNYVKNEKVLIVDKTATTFGKENYNSVNLELTEADSNINLYQRDVAIISNRYAKRNNISLLDKMPMETGDKKFSLIVGGFGYDYNLVYPVIFSSDYFPNTKNEVTYFVNDTLLADDNELSQNYITENSKLFFSYNGSNLQNDLEQFNNHLFLSPLNVTKGTKIAENSSLNNSLRFDAINRLASYFAISFVVIFAITLAVALISIFILISRQLQQRIANLGIMKAEGLKNSEISLEYGIKVGIPTLIAVIVSYPFVLLFQYIFDLIIQPFFEPTFQLDYFALYTIVAMIVLTIVLSLFSYVRSLVFLKKRTIDLIDKKEINKNSFAMTLVDKMKIKKFSSKFALKQFSVSYKKIFSLSFVLGLTVFLSSLFIAIPNDVKEVKDKYFAFYNYNLSDQYQQQVVNIPQNRYVTYDKTGTYESFFPDMYELADGTQIKTDDVDFSGDLSQVANGFVFNLLYLKNKSFSIEGFKSLIQKFTDQNGYDQSGITGILNDFAKMVLPSIFDVSVNMTDNDDYESIITKMVTKMMPAELLQYWSDEETRNNFSFDFMTTNYDNSTDELETKVDGSVNGVDVQDTGAASDQTLLNVDINKLQHNEAYISKKMANTLDLKSGDTFDFNYELPTLEYLGVDKTYHKIDSNDFAYQTDDGDLTDILKTDLSHYTYENTDLEIGKGTPYYFDGTTYRPYYKVQNIVLKIKKADINTEWFNQSYNNPENNLFDSNNVMEDDGENYLIHLYDWRYQSANYVHNYNDVFAMSGSLPINWYDDAIGVQQKGYGSFLKIVNEPGQINYKVKGLLNIYNQNAVYTNQDELNATMGLTSYNNRQYFNTINSSDSRQKDALLRVGFTKLDGNTSITSLGGLKIQTKKNDLLLNELEVLNEIYQLALSMSLMFILMVVTISIIILSAISQQFILQFAKMISILKTIGYKNKEINGMLLKILLPSCIVFVVIAAFIPNFMFMIVNTALRENNILIPSIFNWIIPISTIAIVLMIFGLIYYVNYKKIISDNIQKQMMF